MDSDEEAAAVITILNGHEYRGHFLAVQWATDTDHASMFESMNTPDEQASGEMGSHGRQGVEPAPQLLLGWMFSGGHHDQPSGFLNASPEKRP
jgi:hypothetical protein